MTRITWIRTSPPLPPGSMTACASLIEAAMANGAPAGMRFQACDFFDPAGGSMRRHHLWRIRHARAFFKAHPSEGYHLLDGSMAGFLPRALWPKTVVTVHDLIPCLQMQGRLPGRPGWAGRWMVSRAVEALRQVAGLAADSNHTAKDLAGVTGRTDIAVIPVPVRLLPEPDSRLALPARYLFHVGNNACYKNRSGVLDVFERLQDLEDVHLVLAGPAPAATLRCKAGRMRRVHFLTDVSDAGLAALYRNAAVFLFPSLYEGFGMPVLEAMAAGCPVVCSAAASLPEVVGGAALMAPPDDVEQLARHCRSLLTDASIRDRQVDRGVRQCALFTMKRLENELRQWYTACFKTSES